MGDPENQSFQASITRADENEDGKAKPGAVVYLVDVNVKDGVKYLQVFEIPDGATSNGALVLAAQPIPKRN